MMHNPWVVGKKFGSFLFFYAAFPVLPNSKLGWLSNWYKFIMNNPSNIKKCQQHCFDSWFGPTEYFGCGELVIFHWTLGRFVSGSYWQTHVSSPMMTQPKTSSCLSRSSWQIVTLLCFCSSVSSFGTIYAHTFLMSRSSVKIFLTVSLWTFTCSVRLLTVSWWFSCTIWWIFAMFFQFCLLLAVLISLRWWHFLFPQKNVSPTCTLLFSSKHYPNKISLTSDFTSTLSKFNK